MGRAGDAPESPRVPDTRLWRQCVALAGALAEEGVGTVELIDAAGASRSMMARSADLPDALWSSRAGSALRVETLGLRVDRGEDGLRVSSDDSDAATRVRDAVDTVPG